MSIKVGDKVQVWSDNHKCLGWGEVVRLSYSAKDIVPGETAEPIPLIELENSGKIIWGDKCNWITEEKAVKAGINIHKAIKVDTSSS